MVRRGRSFSKEAFCRFHLNLGNLAFPDLNIGILALEKPDPPEAMNEKKGDQGGNCGEKQKIAGYWAALDRGEVSFSAGTWVGGIKVFGK